MYISRTLLAALPARARLVAARLVALKRHQRHARPMRQRVRRRAGAHYRIEHGVTEELGADDGRADALQAHAVVRLLANRIVDAAEHARHTERMARDLRRQDVAVVA